jgi:trigger factor
VEYTIKEKKSSEISLECTNNGEEIKDSKKEAYTKLSAKVKIPGFRKGKAPYEIGVHYVGEDRILEEVTEILVDKDLNEVLDKEKIIPLGQPEIKVEKIESDVFIFSCKVEFFPEVNVDLDEKIHLRYSSNVSEEEISQKVSEIRDSFIELQPKDGKIEEGDIVEVGLYYEGHEPQTLTIEAGKDKVVGDFSGQIVGKKKGDSFVVKTESSEVNFEVRSCKKKIVPEIGDELAKTAGFENLDAMRKKIKEQLKENKKIHFEENRGREALKDLVEKFNAELPEKFIEHEIEERINDLKDRYLKIGKKIEDVIKEENKTMDDFKKEVRKIVENEIKEDLILREIIRGKNLNVSDEEVRKEFENIALNQGVDTNKVSLTENLTRAIRNEILRSKAILILKENAIIDFGGD